MQFGTVVDATGRTMAAVREAGRWRALPALDLSELLRTGTSTLREAAEHAGDTLLDATTVLPLPRPGKVICCGLNYAEHIRETGRDLPAHPTLFAKYADSLIGPDDEIALPLGLEVDWEAELAVVVGATIRGADAETAQAAIAGYTVANDISVRNWQNRTLQWFQGKAWDRSTPLGPVIVTPDEVDPKAGLPIDCRINGEVVQHDSTSTLVFDAPALLSYISAFTVLRPGDVVLTGTPGGVGLARTPPRFLTDGDVVETEIGGIGLLRNMIRVTDSPG
ncbi:MAG: fumarylacetoacetate hydrolase family protein [Terracoccus sp.]